MVVFEFTFSEGMILEMFCHHRGTRKLARFVTPLRWIVYLLLGALIAGLLFIESYGSAAFLALVLVLFIFSRRLDEWLLLRRCRKSPYYDDRFCLRISAEGLSSKGIRSNMDLNWTVFTEARLLVDGILLFEGPGMFRYLPFDAITRGTAAEAEELVRTHVKNFKVFQRTA